MRTKISMAAIVAAFLLGTAGLGYAQAAEGRASDSGATSNTDPAADGGRGPSGTPLGGGDRSIHTQPSMKETSPGMSGGVATGSSAPTNGGSTGATGSGSSAPANAR